MNKNDDTMYNDIEGGVDELQGEDSYDDMRTEDSEYYDEDGLSEENLEKNYYTRNIDGEQ